MSAVMTSRVSTPDKLQDHIAFQEWKQCQANLEQFDKIIVDLRKYGFGIVTGLISVNGFLFALKDMTPFMIMGIYLALLVLIVGLFRLDRMHEVFLRAAVTRARFLEEQSGMNLSNKITQISDNKKTGTWGVWLYIMFAFAAAFLAWAATAEAIQVAHMADTDHAAALGADLELWHWSGAYGAIFLVAAALIYAHHTNTLVDMDKQLRIEREHAAKHTR